jgi:predicted Zn-dependent protease
MTPPPSRTDLEALAERALSLIGGDGQATAWWERRATTLPARVRTREDVRVELAVGAGIVETSRVDEAGLREAAQAAAALAARGEAPARPLPAPAPGRAHVGYDPSAGSLPALVEAAGSAERTAWWTSAAAKVAIASTRGVRAYEQRSFAGVRLLRPAPRPIAVTAAATSLAGIDAAALAAERDVLAGDGEAVAVGPGEYRAVLAPWAVATVLERLAWRLSQLSGRLGTRVVAPSINLSDSPRFPGTLPRSYDAEGAPKQPLPLIQDGVAHRLVGPETGHARSPGGQLGPEHLVLVGGGAADLAELAAPIEDGLLIGTLDDGGGAHGVRVISGGALGPPAHDLAIRLDPLAILAATEALTARQRLVPSADWRTARRIGATVAPALRTRVQVRARVY